MEISIFSGPVEILVRWMKVKRYSWTAVVKRLRFIGSCNVFDAVFGSVYQNFAILPLAVAHAWFQLAYRYLSNTVCGYSFG